MTEQELSDLLSRSHCRVAGDPLQKTIHAGTITIKEPLTVAEPKKASKYRNKKVVVDGITFDSQKEATRYKELKLMEAAGKIWGLELQEPFILAPSVVINGRKKPDLKYIADFAYWQGTTRVVEDVKSAVTRKLPAYRIKIHLMKYLMDQDVTEI